MLKATAAFLAILCTGCSLRTMAVNHLGDALAAGGSTFTSDDDPRLIGDALPFSLKLMESVLAQSPDHTALLVATSRGFTQYAYGWVAPMGDGDTDPSRSRERAKRLYLRARDYGLRALAPSIPDARNALASDPRSAVARAGRRDVPALYWTAASWALAISLGTDDPELLADLPAVDALISRAAALDPDFERGAIDGFLVAWEGSRAAISKDAERRAREHYRRAVELSDGLSAEPFVTAAETFAVPAQDRAEFESLLDRALAVDIEARPEWRLANVISQRRARWLLDHADELFVAPGNDESMKPR